jgi:hypothetical protein
MNMTITHPKSARTCEVLAFQEVHGLHAHGKVHLPDIPCEKNGNRKKMRK